MIYYNHYTRIRVDSVLFITYNMISISYQSVKTIQSYNIVASFIQNSIDFKIVFFSKYFK